MESILSEKNLDKNLSKQLDNLFSMSMKWELIQPLAASTVNCYRTEIPGTQANLLLMIETKVGDVVPSVVVCLSMHGLGGWVRSNIDW